MDSVHPIGIIGTGAYLPGTVVDNEETARAAGVTAEWIERKTGIRQRRRAAPQEATSDLAAAAALRALDQAGITPERLSYLVVATATPDQPQPATAAIVQHLIGARGAAAFDVNAVCSGFVYALAVAEHLVGAAPEGGHALVVGADVYSRIVDPADRRTAVLFGDGAGAVVVGPVPQGRGTVATSLLTMGDRHELIRVAAGGSRRPASAATLRDGSHHFAMDGRAVRAFVHDALPGAVHRLLGRAGVRPEQVDHFVPHQANGVMLQEVWPLLGLGSAALHLTVDRHGNTGAASIPVTLDLVHRRGLLAEGDLVALCGFGGGMSVGSALLSWAHTRYAAPPRAERRPRAGATAPA